MNVRLERNSSCCRGDGSRGLSFTWAASGADDKGIAVDNDVDRDTEEKKGLAEDEDDDSAYDE